MQYVGLDVSSQLRQNSGNVTGMELGQSHSGVTQEVCHGEPRARAVLSPGFTARSTARIVTDGTWHVTEGPAGLDDVFGRESFDGV